MAAYHHRQIRPHNTALSQCITFCFASKYQENFVRLYHESFMYIFRAYQFKVLFDLLVCTVVWLSIGVQVGYVQAYKQAHVNNLVQAQVYKWRLQSSPVPLGGVSQSAQSHHSPRHILCICVNVRFRFCVFVSIDLILIFQFQMGLMDCTCVHFQSLRFALKRTSTDHICKDSFQHPPRVPVI